MKPFELRLAQVHAREVIHLKNLRSFMADGSRFCRLDEQQQSLMVEQEDILTQYVKILERRMKALNIPI